MDELIDFDPYRSNANSNGNDSDIDMEMKRLGGAKV